MKQYIIKENLLKELLEEKLKYQTFKEVLEFMEAKQLGKDAVIMPTKLTAENGAKKALIGEFQVEYEYTNQEGYDELAEIDIPWTTLKDIYRYIMLSVIHGDITL